MFFGRKKAFLAIGAHPDDIELGCGGCLALHKRQGDTVFALILTLGEASGDPKVRESECRKSAEILGVDRLFFGNLKDTYIGDGPETINVIESVIKETSPALIYTHSSKDSHQDHRNTGLATLAAARYVDCVLMYETPSTLLNFSPQLFVDIKSTHDLKLKATQVFSSQDRKLWREAEAASGLMKFRGFQGGCSYAEAFEVAKFIVRLG